MAPTASVDVIHCLLSRGNADPQAQDRDCCAPLELLRDQSKRARIEQLLQVGASVSHGCV